MAEAEHPLEGGGTDLERLRRLLDSFGVAYVMHAGMTPGTTHVGLPGNEGMVGDKTILVIENDGRAKIGGYDGFFAEWCFEPDGSFIEVGIWE